MQTLNYICMNTDSSVRSYYLVCILQNGKQMVQEGALTALASVADSSQVLHEIVSSLILFLFLVNDSV